VEVLLVRREGLHGRRWGEKGAQKRFANTLRHTFPFQETHVSSTNHPHFQPLICLEKEYLCLYSPPQLLRGVVAFCVPLLSHLQLSLNRGLIERKQITPNLPMSSFFCLCPREELTCLAQLNNAWLIMEGSPKCKSLFTHLSIYALYDCNCSYEHIFPPVPVLWLVQSILIHVSSWVRIEVEGDRIWHFLFPITLSLSPNPTFSFSSQEEPANAISGL